MYSPCDEDKFEKVAYNNYRLARDLPTIIVNYLFDNSPDFWKLLKYSQNPLFAQPAWNMKWHSMNLPIQICKI